MKEFQVWVRPLGNTCRVRVTGHDNGKWLLKHLLDLDIISNGSTAGREESSGSYSFLVPYSARITRSKLADVLAELGEVEVMCEPA